MKKRNGSIDFWKFIFSICLVLLHAGILDYNSEHSDLFIFKRGAIAVEFFFLTSGFLMAHSVNKKKDKKDSTGEETFSFIKRKILSFYPALFTSWILSFIIMNIAHYHGFTNLISNFFESIYELLLIRNAGFDGFRVIPQTWYISAMILSMIIIYPIYTKNKKKFENYIAPIITVFILGYLFHYAKSLVNPQKYMLLLFKSTYRAFAEICLGIFCYSICEKLKKIDFTNFGKVFLAIVEIFGYIFSILYMQFYQMFPSTFDFVILFFLAISVTISFSGLSAITKFFNKSIFSKLGKYSLYPYLTYYGFASGLPLLFPEISMPDLIKIYLVCTFVSAFIVMKLEKYVVLAFNKFKNIIIK